LVNFCPFRYEEEMNPSIGIAVITHNAAHLLPQNLPPLLASSLQPRVMVVNSSSNDGTVELAQKMGAETLVVPRSQFNHGATRELARKTLGTDIVVMITPDAIPCDGEMIANLVQPFLEDDKVGASYARQLPHDGANFFESFPRLFNYPARGYVRSAADLARYGNMTFFCSDSCAAWSNTALDAVGGFTHALVSEDAIAAARLIYAGYKIAYAADAVVKHSHSYSLKQEFKRFFDTGLNRRRNATLLLREEPDSSHGKRFVAAMFRELSRTRPHLMPYGILLVAAKLLGYQLGFHSANAPLWFKKRMSMQDFYWRNSQYCEKP